MSPRWCAAAALLAALLSALAGSGCAHAIHIDSDPPGADVFVDGKHVGVTPVQVEESSGPIDRVPVEVRHGERAARFAYATTGISGEAVGAGAGLAALMCLGGAAGVAAVPVIAILGTGLLAGGPGGAPIFVGAVVVAYSAYLGGLLLAAYAPFALIGTIGEGGRIGPDRIHVDLRQAVPEISSQPGNMVEPWVGRTVAPRRQRY